MAFQIKDFTSIVASMVNYVRGTSAQLTDFARGSVTRTILEAPAVEMDQLYQEMLSGIREGVETSVFRSFGLAVYPDETFDERRERFVQYVQSLARATVGAIEAGAMTAALYDGLGQVTERVKKAIVHEPFLTDVNAPVGFSVCYIHNGVGDTSVALVAETQKIIDGYIDGSGRPVYGWRGAGLPCTVTAVTDVVVDVTATVSSTGKDASATIAIAQDALSKYIAGLEIGKDFDPSCALFSIRVPDVECMKIVSPGIVDIPVGQKAIPGTIVVTVAPS